MGCAATVFCNHLGYQLLLLIILISLTCLNYIASSKYASLSFDYHTLGNLLGEGNTSTFPSLGYVELTISNNDPKNSAGHLYHPDLLPLWSSSTLQSASFNCSFQFQILKDYDSSLPADGLAFALLNPYSPDVLHTSHGSWLGLFNSSTNGTSVGVIAVEFDTYKNAAFDPNDNHIGININSIVSVISEPNLTFKLSTSSSVFSWVDYSSSQALLEVYATNLSDTKPSSPLLSYSINLTQFLPESVRIGFSASTGGYSEYHRMLSWSFNSSTIGLETTMSDWPTVAPPDTRKGSTNVGLFAGLGTGTFIFLAFIALIVGLQVRRQRPGQFDEPVPSGIDMNGLPSLSAREYGPCRFNYRDLVEATRNFGADFLLGQGGFGPVYKGVLWEDGSEVAVKCISQKSAQGEKEFFAEVSIISRIRHKNLVQLKGWCRDKGNLLLVYEYLSNGSLDRYLFTKSSSLTLDWRTRYNIVSGLGSALQYLHQECEKVIVHRDIKASNVMLDTSYNAKLGDFGLARQLRDGVEGHTTRAAGTVGYMAPEMYRTGQVTPESDVYSYGIVLLEVACGRRPVDTSLPSEFEGRLVDWVWDLHSKGRVVEACDSRLAGAFDEEELVRALKVGLACSHPDPKSRPSIRQALEALQGRVPLPSIPARQPVAYYAPPLSLASLFTQSTTSSYSVDGDGDLSERALLCCQEIQPNATLPPADKKERKKKKKQFSLPTVAWDKQEIIWRSSQSPHIEFLDEDRAELAMHQY